MINGESAFHGGAGMPTKSRSRTITIEVLEMSKRDFPPIHPGEILLEEFLEPMAISQYRLAKDMSVDPRRINEIVLGKRSISADTALRLGRYFGTSARFWVNLQSHYDLEVVEQHLGERLQEEVAILA
jgi:addiction module HigA family antidote